MFNILISAFYRKSYKPETKKMDRLKESIDDVKLAENPKLSKVYETAENAYDTSYTILKNKVYVKSLPEEASVEPSSVDNGLKKDL